MKNNYKAVSNNLLDCWIKKPGMVNLTKVFLRAILGQFWGSDSFFIDAFPIFFLLTGVCPVGRELVKGL